MTSTPPPEPTAAGAVTIDGVTLDQPWKLSESVALRPEPFGALAYHFGNRRLTFLKRPELVTVVRHLRDRPDVRAAFEAAGVAADDHPAYLAALSQLAQAGVITRKAHRDPGP
jgi:mycofactocin biosynthesis protein MftB